MPLADDLRAAAERINKKLSHHPVDGESFLYGLMRQSLASLLGGACLPVVGADGFDILTRVTAAEVVTNGSNTDICSVRKPYSLLVTRYNLQIYHIFIYVSIFLLMAGISEKNSAASSMVISSTSEIFFPL